MAAIVASKPVDSASASVAPIAAAARQRGGGAEARHVDRDHLALARDRFEHAFPHLPLAPDPVDQHYRLAAPGAVMTELHSWQPTDRGRVAALGAGYAGRAERERTAC